MARIAGVERPPFLIRSVINKTRKMFGKELVPMQIKARVPRVFWSDFWGMLLLGRKPGIEKRLSSLLLIRAASRVGCPF
jgi:hypothetical protein